MYAEPFVAGLVRLSKVSIVSHMLRFLFFSFSFLRDQVLVEQKAMVNT